MCSSDLINLAPGETVTCRAVDNPQDENPRTREVALTREVYIEQDDFAEVPPPKYFRLKPGGEVRLKYACIIRCDEVVKDAAGHVTELRCTADLSTRAGEPNADRKVKGTIHWVSAAHAQRAEVRLYDRLFQSEDPGAGGRDPLSDLNAASLERLEHAMIEPLLATAAAGARFQFERQGYFCVDPDSQPGAPVFNRTVTLKDTWAKLASKG